MKRPNSEINEIRTKFPSVPEYAIVKTRKKRSPSNELTYQIIKYVQSLGGQAYRINSQGQYDPRIKKWRHSGMKRGLGDIQAVLKGMFISIEIKIGPDKLSDHQKAREAEIKQAGGHYIVAKGFETFKQDMQTILSKIQ